jgi:YHS domain-containing protein
MNLRFAYTAIFLCFIPYLSPSNAGTGKKDDAIDAKEALQALQDFIGNWKGDADGKKLGRWTEKSSWGWRFKGKDVWLQFTLDNSKLYKSGEVRYLPDKSKYQFTLIDKADKRCVFEGEIKKDMLTVERVNPDSKDTEQLKLSVISDGDRLIYSLWIKPDGRTQYTEQLRVGYTREGVTFGVEPGSKRPVCVVTGGLGTIQVSYMGATYYVCCSGCRDAFNENPAKVIADFNKKKKKGGG